MMHLFACAAGLALGLYAGKRREHGDGWEKIAGDLCSDTIRVSKAAWNIVAWPFRKGKPDAEKEPEA